MFLRRVFIYTFKQLRNWQKKSQNVANFKTSLSSKQNVQPAHPASPHFCAQALLACVVLGVSHPAQDEASCVCSNKRNNYPLLQSSIETRRSIYYSLTTYLVCIYSDAQLMHYRRHHSAHDDLRTWSSRTLLPSYPPQIRQLIVCVQENTKKN